MDIVPTTKRDIQTRGWPFPGSLPPPPKHYKQQTWASRRSWVRRRWSRSSRRRWTRQTRTRTRREILGADGRSACEVSARETPRDFNNDLAGAQQGMSPINHPTGDLARGLGFFPHFRLSTSKFFINSRPSWLVKANGAPLALRASTREPVTMSLFHACWPFFCFWGGDKGRKKPSVPPQVRRVNTNTGSTPSAFSEYHGEKTTPAWPEKNARKAARKGEETQVA